MPEILVDFPIVRGQTQTLSFCTVSITLHFFGALGNENVCKQKKPSESTFSEKSILLLEVFRNGLPIWETLCVVYCM